MVVSPRTCQACHTALAPEQLPYDPSAEISCPNCGAAIPPLSTTFKVPQKPGLHDTALSLSPESSDLGQILGLNPKTIVGPHSPPSSPDFPFLAPPQESDELGRLGPYRVMDVIGMGGMGIVFRGEDPQLKRQIALKAMLPAYATSSADVARFLREARAQAAVEHDHVAAIHQVGEDRGVPFIAMPLLKGQTLAGALRAHPKMHIPEAVRIAREMAEGLAAAHECGLIHRDIKPANVWLEGKNRRVKILDFGLARMNGATPQMPGDSTPMTQQGVVVGTPAYMSPEQAKGEPLDRRSDLFSLGIVLYQMLAGQEPFRSGTMTGLLIAVATEHPPRPSELNPAVPPDLDDLTMQLLAKNRDLRPSTGEEIALQLRSIESGLVVAALVAVPLAMPASDSGLKTPSSDAWGKLASSGTQVDATPTFEEPSVHPLQRARGEEPPRKRPWLLIAALLAFVAVTAVAADIIIKITNKDGSVTEIKLPDGTKIEVGGKVVTPNKLPMNGDGEPTQFDHRRAAQHAIQLGGRVSLDNQSAEIATVAALPKQPFVLTALHFSDLKTLSDKDLAAFNGCDTLRVLWLSQSGVTDVGLANFKGCDQLTFLALDATPTTDAGLANFKGCKNLQSVFLNSTRVGDAGLADLAECRELRELWLDDSRVTDAGLLQLKKHQSLRTLNVRADGITGMGAREITKSLPFCEIQWKGGKITATRDPDAEAARWAVSLGGLVRVTTRGGLLKTLDAIPAPPYKLVHVELRGINQLTDAGLANLKDCKNLTSLWLSDTPVTDAGMVNFREWASLETLVLGGCKNLTDKGLANFEQCKNLKTLWLNETKITNEGLAIFKDCKALEHLELINTQVSDAGLANFKEYKNLKELWLRGSPISDVGLASLQECKALKSLDVQQTQVTAKGIASFQKAFPNCKVEWDKAAAVVPQFSERQAAEFVLSRKGKVWINNRNQPHEHISSLAMLPKERFTLTGIDLYNLGLSDPDMNRFQDCKDLTFLGLTETKIGDVGLAAFKDCKKLQRLHLKKTPVTDEGLAYFKDCKGLYDILLDGTSVTDKGLANFKDCPILTTLQLSDTLIGDDGLANFKGANNVRWLTLSNTKTTDTGLANFKDSAGRMTVLHLQGTQVTDTGLGYFQKSEKLEQLDVTKTKITAAKLESLAAGWPKCVILSDFKPTPQKK